MKIFRAVTFIVRLFGYTGARLSDSAVLYNLFLIWQPSPCDLMESISSGQVEWQQNETFHKNFYVIVPARKVYVSWHKFLPVKPGNMDWDNRLYRRLSVCRSEILSDFLSQTFSVLGNCLKICSQTLNLRNNLSTRMVIQITSISNYFSIFRKNNVVLLLSLLCFINSNHR